MWYCSVDCKRADKRAARKPYADAKFRYTQRLVWEGLIDLCRRDAIRHNDRNTIVEFWKSDLLQFFLRNHPKYILLGHRLISSINGWLPERLRNDLIWNRTVNLRGGIGNNLEADLVNEFLNREFKEGISSVGARTTSDTLESHGKIAGGFSREVHESYTNLVESDVKQFSEKKEFRREEDLNAIVTFYKQRIYAESSGRGPIKHLQICKAKND